MSLTRPRTEGLRYASNFGPAVVFSGLMLFGRRAPGICGPALRRTVWLFALLTVGTFAAPAFGAEYTFVGCAGQSASLSGWVGYQPAGPTSQVGPENCATAGSGMPAVLRNGTAPGRAGWQLSAPAGTTIAAVALQRTVAVASKGFGYSARGTNLAESGFEQFEGCQKLTATDCGAVNARTSSAHRFARTDINLLRVFVFCTPTTSQPCDNAPNNVPASERITRSDVTLTDNAAPTVTAGPTSAMFSANAPVSGVQSIAVRFNDVGGGIASTGVQVDDQTVSEVPVSNSPCRTPYRRPVPCPRNVSTTLQFNPASVPDGAHRIRVFARDATGANLGYSAELSVTTSARGAINGTHGSDRAKLSVGVRRSVTPGHAAPTAHSTITVPFNATTVAEGRLVNRAGQPVIGARLTVATAVDRGVPLYADLPADVITDSKGRFKVTLPRGPSWRVRVLYFAHALDSAPASRDDARTKVATHASFAPRHREVLHGSRAVFRGHVVGSYRPAGIRVELQGRRRQGYVTLSSAATRADGTYRVSYRFTSRARGRYVFRLRVRHFPRFPYFLGYSRPASVLVR